MKLLFKNKRNILSIFLTAFMVFCTLMSGYADITPVQDRTPQIPGCDRCRSAKC